MGLTFDDVGVRPVRSSQEFDSLRAKWASTPKKVIVKTVADSPFIDNGFSKISLMLRGAETGGGSCLAEHRFSLNAAVGSHYQTTEDEGFYVLEGKWEFLGGDVTRQVGPGEIIFAPMLRAHAFKCIDPNGGRILNWSTPAGHENFYVGMTDSRAAGENARLVAAPRYHTVFPEFGELLDSGKEELPATAQRVIKARADSLGEAAFISSGDTQSTTGVDVVELIGDRLSGGRDSLFEIRSAADQESVAFEPKDSDVSLYVIEGDWDIQAGTRQVKGGPAVVVFVPAGVGLKMRLVGDKAGKIVALCVPAQLHA